MKSLAFCLGIMSRIKEKINLFREEKTKGKVRQLGIQKTDVKKYENCLLLRSFVPNVEGKKCGDPGRTIVSEKCFAVFRKALEIEICF